MTDAPPSRYHIVERGRRLVVIDRWQGGYPRTPTPSPTQRQAAIKHKGDKGGLRQVSFDGRAQWVTHPAYDRKGPRHISLDAASAATIRRARTALVAGAAIYAALAFWQPWLIVPALAVLAPSKSRERLRDASTALVDRIATRSAG